MTEVLKLVYWALKDLSSTFFKDPRVQHLPLVGSPVLPFLIILIYGFFVKIWGPKWMSDRKPYNVTTLIRIHNTMQILLNVYAFSIGIQHSYGRSDFSWTCRAEDYEDTSPQMMQLLHACYIYYITKYLDLFDTVFFVLRKKNNQVSFLHVYHHIIMVFAVWLYMTFFFGSHQTMLGIVNSVVHMFMYTYYLLSSFDLPFDLLPWKKRITQIQILQFCYLVIHFLMPVFNNWCNLKFNAFNMVAVIQNIFMAFMFLDFYVKTYIKKDANKT